MSRQLGSIDDWSTSSNSGSIDPDQGQRPSVFRDDCSPDVQARLDAGNIPPNSEIRVSYETDFSTGSPIAKNVQSAALTATAQAARSSMGGPSRKIVARAKRAKRSTTAKKRNKTAKPNSPKRNSAKKSARKRNR